jgi:hypothetical protein
MKVILNKGIGLQPSDTEDICLFAVVLRLQLLEQPAFQTDLMLALFKTGVPTLQTQKHTVQVDALLKEVGFALGQVVYNEKVLPLLLDFELKHTSSRTDNRCICSKCQLSIGSNLQELVCCSGTFPGADCVNNVHMVCAASTSAVKSGTSSSWMATPDMECALCPTCFRAKEQVHSLQQSAARSQFRPRRAHVLDDEFKCVFPTAVNEANDIVRRLFYHTSYDHVKNWNTKKGFVENLDLYLSSVLEQLKQTSFGCYYHS